MAEIKLGNKIVNDDSPAYLIAEIGHNHQGDVKLAMDMVNQAHTAGADCVKFQRIDSKRLFTEAAYNEPYNGNNAFAPTYGKHREAVTLSDDNFKQLFEHCQSIGITFGCTPFEEWSADFLNELGCEVFKMASFHMHDDRLISHVMDFDKPIIFSTGNSSYQDVGKFVDALDYDKIAVLQCTSEYPVRDTKHINLGAISYMREVRPDIVWGYSHHHPSPFAAACSYVFGARIVEVHFTTGRSMKGTDQAFSATPDDLRWLRSKLDMAREMGGYDKSPYNEEAKPIGKMSRGLWVTEDIKAGENITADNVILKAPATSLKANAYYEIIGTNAKHDMKAGDEVDGI